MKSIYVMLSASLLIAGIPMIAASHTGCAYHTPEEGIAHPASKGHYILIDAAKPDKVGEWVDTNGRTGLQSDDCLFGSITMYRADKRAEVLP